MTCEEAHHDRTRLDGYRCLVCRLSTRDDRRIAPTDPSGGHRLIRVEGWLDHLVSLGCNGLLLGPIFTSRSHGYDTLDYFSIDPRLGDDADFDSLVAACHARGIKSCWTACSTTSARTSQRCNQRSPHPMPRLPTGSTSTIRPTRRPG